MSVEDAVERLEQHGDFWRLADIQMLIADWRKRGEALEEVEALRLRTEICYSGADVAAFIAERERALDAGPADGER